MHQVVHTDTVARCNIGDIVTHSFNLARHFVAESHGQLINLRDTGSIVRVGVTDAARLDTNQDFTGSNLRNTNFRLLQRFSDVQQSDCSHPSPLLTLLRVVMMPVRRDFVR